VEGEGDLRRSAGEGSITQRTDGRWQASLQIEGVRRFRYGKTRKEAAQKLAKLQALARRTGRLPDAQGRTVGDLLETWLEVSAPALKPRTIQTYRQVVDRDLAPLADVRLDRLTPDRVQNCYASLQAKGLVRAPAKAHAVLHRACEVAVLWGWLGYNVTERVIAPKYRAPRKDVWTFAELTVFRNGAHAHWLYPFWMVAIVSGCRPGELRALCWPDVDLKAGTITITKTLQRVNQEWILTSPKTRSGIRTLALPAEGVQALEMQRERQDRWRRRASWRGWLAPLVYTKPSGKPLYAGDVSHPLRAECERLGIRYLSPHALRHLHASLLLAEGLAVPAVSARLGHASPAITLSVYAHAVGDDSDAAAAVGRALGRKEVRRMP
jgi:integrase